MPNVSNSPVRVLVVDDDEVLRETVCAQLEEEGYETGVAADGRVGGDIGLSWDPAIILLDVIMPELDGFEACRRIRRHSAVPIIMLTARGSPQDRVEGLDAGADDYLPKPFSTRELMARIRAVLRRSQTLADSAEPDELICGNIKLVPASREVTVRDIGIDLSPREYQLLDRLLRRPDRAISYRNLLASAWGPEYRDDIAALRVNIARLRGKIERDPSHPHYLQNRRGVGYLLSSAAQPESEDLPPKIPAK